MTQRTAQLYRSSAGLARVQSSLVGDYRTHSMYETRTMTPREMHLQTRIILRDSLRSIVDEFAGQWVTAHDIADILQVMHPEESQFAGAKSVAEYMKMLSVASKKAPQTLYECRPVDFACSTTDSIKLAVMRVLSRKAGCFLTANGIYANMIEDDPALRGTITPASVREILKTLPLRTTCIKTGIFLCRRQYARD